MLPGKLCIGILEEDNPLKSYFRMMPLLVENGGRYEVFDSKTVYPEEGSIRIVPDKNESSHFKARMRRMGRYCVLDLREHAGENDKIRPNKNYRGDDSERNAYIIYSDVVREPADDMIFEIAGDEAPEDGASCTAEPGTPRVLFGGNETWKCRTDEAGGFCGLVADGEELPEAELQRFDLEAFRGQRLRFAVRLPALMESVTRAARLEMPEPGLAPQPAAPAFAPQTAAPAFMPQPAVPAFAAQPAAPAPAPRPAAPASAAQPAAIRPQETAAPARAVEAPVEKPWISRDAAVRPPFNAGARMTPLQQVLAAQSGLNPRRNRSLQEIIEEKWRHSRVDQLGHPVPATAMGQPVENPVEAAVRAVRTAWQNPAIRAQLLEAMAAMEEFGAGLNRVRRAAGDRQLERELEDLEAERLRALDELDRLRREKRTLRDRFRQEVREEEAEKFADAVERTRAAQAECEKALADAAQAKDAARAAEEALSALSDGSFEEKLREFALTSHAAEYLNCLRTEKPAEALPEGVSLDRDALLARLTGAFGDAGLEMNEIQAANLLVCLALNSNMLLSGPALSDKELTARLIARALGAEDADRLREAAGASRRAGAWEPGELAQPCDLPAVLYIDAANRAPDAEIFLGAELAQENLLRIASVSDSGSGFPVPVEALAGACFVRLKPPAADAEWKSSGQRSPAHLAPVSMRALREAMLAHPAELPPALERRLQKLRAGLAAFNVFLPRRTLDAMYRYCGAMLALGKISPAEALDLALAQMALPALLAEAPVECLAELKNLFAGMPHCTELLNAPLPIWID